MAALIQRLLAEFGGDHSDGLQLGGQPAVELAERFGTPAFVYDAAVLRSRLARVRAALGPRVDVLFAIKSNPNLAVVKTLTDAGAGADVASAGELLLALRAGLDPRRIQFAGPGKSPSELALAVQHGIGRINLESESEYEVLARVVHERQPAVRPGVALRLNPTHGATEARMRMAGGASKFGVDESVCTALARRIVDDGVCELEGVHCYLGTQMFDAGAWLSSVTELASFVRTLEATLGRAPLALNLGGGFGVPYFDGEPSFDLARAAAVQDVFADEPARPLCVELGRYLAAPAGAFLTRVLHAKVSHGRRYAVLDGGLHQFGAAAGLGSVLRRPYPIVRADAPTAAGVPQSLCGPLCTPADEFGAALDLPELGPGDVVAILAAGAYGLSFSPTMFLSQPLPREILCDGGAAWLVREPGRPEDALRGQHLPGER